MRVITILKKNELHNSDNYNDELDVTVNDLMEAYSRILINYHQAIRDGQYTKFTIFRGIDTLSTVFHYMIFYTRNLALALSYSEKAYLFYIEFISQISDAEKLFLRLSSRDASIYVFGKTIADIKYMTKPADTEKISEFKRVADVLKTIAFKYHSEETFAEISQLIAKHGITDDNIQQIDELYYSSVGNKEFNESVISLLACAMVI